MTEAVWVAIVGGAFTLAGIVIPLTVGQRATHRRIEKTTELTESADAKGTQILDLLERVLFHMSHQDERLARHEYHMNKVLTRLGRIEACQRQNHQRISDLEGKTCEQ